MSAGVELIAAERRRQVEAEGWTPEHDDEHTDAELLAAAGRYLDAGHFIARTGRTDGERFFHGSPPDPSAWPWWNTDDPAELPKHEGWKPDWSDPIRNLVKAGALIAAEIDRLTRAAGVDRG